MLCLALLAKLTSREVSVPVSKQVLTPRVASRINEACQGDQSEPARGYFGPQKASKTLDITVATARYAVSQSRSGTCATTLGTMIEILNLCTEVARSVDGTDKRNWIMTRGTMSKAPLNGLLKSEVDSKARLAVRCLCVSVLTIQIISYRLLSLRSLCMTTHRFPLSSVAWSRSISKNRPMSPRLES